MHDEQDFSNGIAVFHEECYNGEIPTLRSQSDPNQGWGDDDDEECLTRDTEGEGKEYSSPRVIPGYDVEKDLMTEKIRSRLWRIDQDIQFETSFEEKTDGKYGGIRLASLLVEKKELDEEMAKYAKA